MAAKKQAGKMRTAKSRMKKRQTAGGQMKKRRMETSDSGITGSIRANALLFPVMFVLGVLPLILRYHSYDSKLSGFSWHAENGKVLDFFLYYKGVWFLLASAVMLLLLVYYGVREKRQRRGVDLWLLIPVAVYAIFTLLSAVFSKQRYFAVHGVSDHFEGLFVHLGYCIAVLYAAYFLRTKEQLKAVINVWNVGILLLLLFGIFQLAGVDVINSKLMTWLMFPAKFWPKAGTLLNNVFEKGRVYVSLYNPNYVGTYVVLVFPVLLSVCLVSEKKWKKLVYFLEAVLLFLCLLGSGARSGLLALCVTVPLLLLLNRGNLKEWKRQLLALAVLAVVFCGTFLGYNEWKNHSVTERLESGLFQEETQENTAQENTAQENGALEKIETLDDCIEITYGGETLRIECEKDADGRLSLILMDKDGKKVETEAGDEGGLRLLDDRFPFAVYQIDSNNILNFAVTIDGTDWVFSNQTGYKGYFYLNRYGKYTKIENAKPVLFTDRYRRMFSGRGYIWGRSIPLLKDSIMIGSGPDTFTFRFPQRDYVGAKRAAMSGAVVSKPHNMYLQIGIQNGCIALLAFLALYVIYAVRSLKLYWKRRERSRLSRMGAGFFVGITGYMLVGLVNDSMIVTAPLFWVVLGMGWAVNRIVEGSDGK